MPAGRPKLYKPEDYLDALAEYIETTPIPIIAEFAYLHNMGKASMYDMGEESEEFSTLLKKCISKKEAALERSGLNGDTNPAMTIFSLKQLGWTDRQENTLKGDQTAPIAVSMTAKDW